MVSKPKCGWSYWTLDNFKEPISYVDDFPFVLLDKIKCFFESEECQEIEFDAEGYFYKIYLGFPVYAKSNKNQECVQICDDMVMFTTQLLEDINRDFEDWVLFPYYCDTCKDKEKIEEELKRRTEEVRGAMNEWMKRAINME